MAVAVAFTGAGAGAGADIAAAVVAVLDVDVDAVSGVVVLAKTIWWTLPSFVTTHKTEHNTAKTLAHKPLHYITLNCTKQHYKYTRITTNNILNHHTTPVFSIILHPFSLSFFLF